MIRIINWIRQNLVTVVEVAELVARGIQTLITAASRVVAFTETTSDDEFVAKIDGFVRSLLVEPIQAIKSFLLGDSG